MVIPVTIQGIQFQSTVKGSDFPSSDLYLQARCQFLTQLGVSSPTQVSSCGNLTYSKSLFTLYSI